MPQQPFSHCKNVFNLQKENLLKDYFFPEVRSADRRGHVVKNIIQTLIMQSA